MRHFFIGAISSIIILFGACSSGTTVYAEGTVNDGVIKNIIQVVSKEKPAQTKRQYEKIPVSQLQVGNLSPDVETTLDYTDWWYSKWDDCRYIYLPVTADRSKLTITYTADNTLCLNGEKVESGEMTSLLGKEDEFKITVGDKECGILKIMQSDTGCIYLSTASGGLDALDANKDMNETGYALMLNAYGGTEYSGEIEKLTGRGNSSWLYSEKKPYNIKLPKKEYLYNMGKAKKWALISNYMDHSMLRNKVTQEICRAAQMEYTVDMAFVDLYADGSYRGTYQLSEKVQIQKNRIRISDLEEETEKLNDKKPEEYQQKVVGASASSEYKENCYKYYDIPNDPDDITGGYLLQLQQWNRYERKVESGFVTSRGQTVSIDGPEYASKAQVEYIRGFVQDMEDALYSATGYNDKGKCLSNYVDIDSFAVAYLVEEISMNVDAAYSSFYFWKDSDKNGDGKLHFCPAWDHDLSYDNYPTLRTNSDGEKGYSYRTDNLFAAYFPINGYQVSKRPTIGVSWIGEFYKQEKFQKRIAEIYFERFMPFLTELTKGETPYMTKLGESVRSSAEMSNARWHTYGGADYCAFGSSSGATYMESVELVRDFIEKRMTWLSNLWQPLVVSVHGDVNSDGRFDIEDVVMLQKWFLRAEEMPQRQAADLNKDDKINILDLCIIKNELVYG